MGKTRGGASESNLTSVPIARGNLDTQTSTTGVQTKREDHVRTWPKDGYLQAEEKGLRKDSPTP